MFGSIAVTQSSWGWAQEEIVEGAQIARARPDLAVAKKHYDDGEVKFQDRDYVGAEIDFRIANGIKGTAQAERYIGRCLDAIGRYASAVEWFEKFLAHAPTKMALLAERTRRRMAAIRAMPGQLHVESTPAGATVSIDGERQSAPTPLDVDLRSGSHTITIAAVGRRTIEKSIEVAFASSQSVNADLALAAPSPSATTHESITEADEALSSRVPAVEDRPAADPPSRVAAYMTGGLAIVAAGTGAMFGVTALNDKSTFERSHSQTDAARRNEHALAADIAVGSALALGVTSLVLFFTSSAPKAPDDDAKRLPIVSGGSKSAYGPKGMSLTSCPVIGVHGAGGALLLRF